MQPPIGKENFKDIIEGDYYFVDKSLFIQDVLEDASSVLLLPRPRRFGKTVNLSMLRAFLERQESPDEAKRYRALFDGLKINQSAAAMEQLGQYPVIALSFKSLKAPSFSEFVENFKILMAKEYKRHDKVLEDANLSEYERQRFAQVLAGKADNVVLKHSLSELTQYLHDAYGKKVVLLIDEYDAPLHEGYRRQYYDDIIDFVKSLLGNALKGNEYLYKGVLSGILRVSRESIFSDLNHLTVFTVLDAGYAQYFGFTEQEVGELLEYYGIADTLPDVRLWYNGYQFGKHVIYNPWSILSFLYTEDRPLKPYWINTSANELVRDLVLRSDGTFQKDLACLLRGETILKKVETNLVLLDLPWNNNAVWSLLLFSGYLKPVKRVQEGRHIQYELGIPNLEVSGFYYDTLSAWFEQRTGSEPLQKLLSALTQGDVQSFNIHLQELIKTVLSYYDVPTGKNPEAVYHGFMLGLLAHLEGLYTVTSNREAGLGRYDVMLMPNNVTELGVVMEFKAMESQKMGDEGAGGERSAVVEKALAEALKQIRDRDYTAPFRAAGVTRVLEVAVLFCGKVVFVEGKLG